MSAHSEDVPTAHAAEVDREDFHAPGHSSQRQDESSSGRTPKKGEWHDATPLIEIATIDDSLLAPLCRQFGGNSYVGMVIQFCNRCRLMTGSGSRDLKSRLQDRFRDSGMT